MLLVTIVLIAWNVNSQTVTKKKDSVTVSRLVAQKIKLDLIDYDRLIENKVEKNLTDCILLQKEKDTIINFMQLQYKISKETLMLTEKQLRIREDQLKFNKKKSGKGWLWGVGGVAVGIITGILVIN